VFIEGGKTLSLNLEEKKAVVAELGAELANAQTVVVAEYRGIGVVGMTALRAKARANGVYLRVLKNTLARRAVAGTPFARLDRPSGRAVGIRDFQRPGSRRKSAFGFCQS